jgi:hypothetical protein
MSREKYAYGFVAQGTCYQVENELRMSTHIRPERSGEMISRVSYVVGIGERIHAAGLRP